MEGEPRLERFDALAEEDEGVGLAGGAEIVGVEGAIRVEDLGEAEADPCAAIATDAELDPADHILTHVDDGGGIVAGSDGRRGEMFGDADWLGPIGDEEGVIARGDADRRPSGIVEAGGIPAGQLIAGVVGLTHQEISGDDGTGRASP